MKRRVRGRGGAGGAPAEAGPAPARYDVPAVRQVLQVIELLCESEQPLGVSQIGQALRMNKSMVFRLLQTLLRGGWVVRDEDRQSYRMGLRPFHYVSKPVSRMNLLVASEGPVRSLWQATGESTYLGVLDQDKVLYLEHLNATGTVQIAGKVGGRYTLHCSAPGKILLAHAGEDLLNQLIQRGLERQTRHTICQPVRLRNHLREVARQGYAMDLEEYAEGCLCFAAPIRNYTGKVVAVVGVSVLTLYYTAERLSRELGPKVRETARAVSLALGYDERAAARSRTS